METKRDCDLGSDNEADLAAGAFAMKSAMAHSGVGIHKHPEGLNKTGFLLYSTVLIISWIPTQAQSEDHHHEDHEHEHEQVPDWAGIQTASSLFKY